MCYVEELVVPASNNAVRREQNENHGDTSDISSLGSRSGEEMDVVSDKQASNVYATD